MPFTPGIVIGNLLFSNNPHRLDSLLYGQAHCFRVPPAQSLLYDTLHTVTESLRLSFRPHTKIRAVWGFSPTVRRWYWLNLRRRMRPRIGALYE
jgi:hypothetical protein